VAGTIRDYFYPTFPKAMKLKNLIKRLLGAGLTAGVLTFALGFANVFEQANPPIVLTLLAPYGQDLLVVGVIMSGISGAALLVIRRFA